jgi:hypothetical protein
MIVNVEQSRIFINEDTKALPGAPVTGGPKEPMTPY